LIIGQFLKVSGLWSGVGKVHAPGGPLSQLKESHRGWRTEGHGDWVSNKLADMIQVLRFFLMDW
jgi:hypothetical protein